MKGSKELFSKLKYGDFIIFGAVLAVSLMLFLLSVPGGDKLCAEISLDGELYSSVKLYEIEDKKVIEAGSCRILLERDGASFISSDCRDKLCINRGKLKNPGDTMACVPERVSVVLKSSGDDGFDAVAF